MIDEEETKPLADFSWLGSVFCVSTSAFTLSVGYTKGIWPIRMCLSFLEQVIEENQGLASCQGLVKCDDAQ